MAAVFLIAQRAFPYNGQSIAIGQRFAAVSAHDAFALKTIGHATEAPPPVSAWDAVSVDVPVTIPTETAVRAYRRRRAKPDSESEP